MSPMLGWLPNLSSLPPMKCQHLVVTRYTVIGWAYRDFSQDWLEQRLRLFRTYCVPSMAQQQVEDFTWVVGCDKTTDPEYVAAIEESAALVPQLRVVETSFKPRLKLRAAMRPLVEPDTDLLITTRLDNDDALHRVALSTVHDYIKPFVHSGHAAWALHFPRGYRYDEGSNRLYSAYWLNSPFVTSFERLGEDKQSFWDLYNVPHTKVQMDLPFHNDESIPGWMQVIHGRAESTQPETLSGVALTSGNRRSEITREDLEVELMEAEAFGVELPARGGEAAVPHRQSM